MHFIRHVITDLEVVTSPNCPWPRIRILCLPFFVRFYPPRNIILRSPGHVSNIKDVRRAGSHLELKQHYQDKLRPFKFIGVFKVDTYSKGTGCPQTSSRNSFVVTALFSTHDSQITSSIHRNPTQLFSALESSQRNQIL